MSFDETVTRTENEQDQWKLQILNIYFRII